MAIDASAVDATMPNTGTPRLGSIRKSATGPLTSAERLGRDLAAELLDDGAGRLVGVRARALEEETVP